MVVVIFVDIVGVTHALVFLSVIIFVGMMVLALLVFVDAVVVVAMMVRMDAASVLDAVCVVTVVVCCGSGCGECDG